VLRDKVASTRMQTTSEEAGHYKVDQGVDTRELVEGIVENELNDNIESMPSSRRLGPYETRSQRVKQNLERTIGETSGSA